MIEEVWVEKYRPRKIDDIVGQADVTKRLKNYVKERNLPNMLFAGAPGIGKDRVQLMGGEMTGQLARLAGAAARPLRGSTLVRAARAAHRPALGSGLHSTPDNHSVRRQLPLGGRYEGGVSSRL